MRALLSHVCEVFRLQECEHLASNSIQLLGWHLVYSSDRKASIALRGKSCHNIVRSWSNHARLAMVCLRHPCIFLVSAYFPNRSENRSLEVAFEMLKTIETTYRRWKEECRYTCELVIAGDFNVELAPDITCSGGTVTGGAVQILDGRGYGNDTEDRRWEEDMWRSQLQEWLCRMRLLAVNSLGSPYSRQPTFVHRANNARRKSGAKTIAPKVLDYLMVP